MTRRGSRSPAETERSARRQGIAALSPGRSASPDARAIYAEAATVLGQAVANLVNVLSPKWSLVSGEGTQAWGLTMEEAFGRACRRLCLPAASWGHCRGRSVGRREMGGRCRFARPADDVHRARRRHATRACDASPGTPGLAGNGGGRLTTRSCWSLCALPPDLARHPGNHSQEVIRRDAVLQGDDSRIRPHRRGRGDGGNGGRARRDDAEQDDDDHGSGWLQLHDGPRGEASREGADPAVREGAPEHQGQGRHHPLRQPGPEADHRGRRLAAAGSRPLGHHLGAGAREPRSAGADWTRRCPTSSRSRARSSPARSRRTTGRACTTTGSRSTRIRGSGSTTRLRCRPRGFLHRQRTSRS